MVVVISERNIHQGKKFAIERGIRLWFAVQTCSARSFHQWFYCLHLGLRSPSPRGNFPAIIGSGCLKANSSALQTYLNFCVIEQCPSLLSFDLKENSLAETRLLLDEFLFRGACKKGDNSDKGISGVPAPHKGNLPSLSDFRWWSAGSRSRLKSRRSGARRRS